MPIDIDASGDAVPLAYLQQIFDAPLHRAARQLIDLGGVSDVRVLRGGRVVTGIAGDRQRVYVQYQRAGALGFEGAHLVIEKQQGRLRKPSLIVAPVSVLGNWQQEIRRFAPELTLLVLHGAKRKERFASIGAADVILIGYPLLLADGDMLLERDFSFVILDEAQTIKNPQAKVSQVAQALRAEHRLCLSGTPMENHLGDLWSLFNFVQPGLLGERRQFQRLYRTPIENGGDVKRAAA